MLAAWTEILPLFVVRWLALRRCERVRIAGVMWVLVRPGTLVREPR